MKVDNVLFFILVILTTSCTLDSPLPNELKIPDRPDGAETGSAFMARIAAMPLAEREEAIFMEAAAGNIPSFLRRTVTISVRRTDRNGLPHNVEYEVMPDYLAIGSDDDFCRIPANPCTAQRIADVYGATLPTALISDDIYLNAKVKLTPFNYIPVGNANELVEKFVDHNSQIERQFVEAGGERGTLTAGIKKDVILSGRIASRNDRVVIYGWHKPDGNPIQPVYSGHIYWYVDYSHGIRLVNAVVRIDGRNYNMEEILSDPVMFSLMSNEEEPMVQTRYICGGYPIKSDYDKR